MKNQQEWLNSIRDFNADLSELALTLNEPMLVSLFEKITRLSPFFQISAGGLKPSSY